MTLKLEQIAGRGFQETPKKMLREIPRKRKNNNKLLGKMSKEHYENRFVDQRKDRRALSFNIILFAQKEVIFVKEKPPQTM